jgi:hypothetical protein
MATLAMMKQAARRMARRAVRPATVIALAAGLAGCMDTEGKVQFHPDGAVTLTARLVFDKEMEDVFAFAQQMARLSTDPGTAALGAGVCGSVEAAAAGAPPGVALTARQAVEGDRLVCEIQLRAQSSPKEELNANDVLIITDGKEPRQKDIRIDFEKLPDLSELFREEFAEQMKQTGAISPDATSRDIEELAERGKKAIVAVTAMFARNRYLEIAVEGERVVASSSEVAQDGRTVKLRMTYAELVDVLLKPEARKGRKYFAVIAY